MTTRRGFTLMDLSFAAVCLALVAVIVLPTLQATRRGGHWPSCAMNLSYLGKAIGIYAASYDDAMPFLPGHGWDVTPTGTHRDTEPAPDKARANTALMFLLMREGIYAKMFVCPDDKGATTDDNILDASGDFFWDFNSAANCSYAYQLPLSDNSVGAPPRDVPNGTDKSSPLHELVRRGENVVLIADKPPAINLGAYAAGSKVKTFMSPNHGGDYINYLRADLSVRQSRTPNCGEGGDYIYTASGYKGGGSPYGGSPTQAAHLSPLDSCLVGPK